MKIHRIFFKRIIQHKTEKNRKNRKNKKWCVVMAENSQNNKKFPAVKSAKINQEINL